MDERKGTEWKEIAANRKRADASVGNGREATKAKDRERKKENNERKKKNITLEKESMQGINRAHPRETTHAREIAARRELRAKVKRKSGKKTFPTGKRAEGSAGEGKKERERQQTKEERESRKRKQLEQKKEV